MMNLFTTKTGTCTRSTMPKPMNGATPIRAWEELRREVRLSAALAMHECVVHSSRRIEVPMHVRVACLHACVQARRLEGELDVKLSSFNKLCSGFEASTGRDSGVGSEQLSSSMAADIESLLTRLSDINDQMSSLLGGSHDSRAHLLARHRDILQVICSVDHTACMPSPPRSVTFQEHHPHSYHHPVASPLTASPRAL